MLALDVQTRHSAPNPLEIEYAFICMESYSLYI